MAILPAEVILQLRPSQIKKTTSEEVEKARSSEGYAVQKKLYEYLLSRGAGRHPYTVSFQDVNQTNVLLKKAQLNYKDLLVMPKAVLAKILGVDAVISTSVRTEKPISDGGAVAVGLIEGTYTPKNKAYTTIYIHEGLKGSLLWRFNCETTGVVASSPARLTEVLMRKASKSFPYSRK